MTTLLQDHVIALHHYRYGSEKTPSQALLQSLSHEEIHRYQSYKYPHLRREYLEGRYFLRKILAQYMGCHTRAVPLSTLDNGKPYVLGSKLYFNLSHAGEFIILGITKVGHLGIDIEEKINSEDLRPIASRFFSNLEYSRIEQLDDLDFCKHFYRIWTRKEAFIKADGQGLSYPLKDFSVSSDRTASSIVFHGIASVSPYQIIPLAENQSYTIALDLKSHLGVRIHWDHSDVFEPLCQVLS